MDRSIEDLIESLNSDDEFVIEEAMGLLEMKADEAIDPLISALSSRKKNIRLNADNGIFIKFSAFYIDFSF